jgi:holo-[acyl-carrier protein] synthase
VIVGLGNDLIREARITEVLARHGQRFTDRLLMPEERAALPSAPPRRANRLAKAFAAKEAFAKAWGSGFAGVTHHDCGVRRDAAGKPDLIFSDRMQTRLAARGVTRTHLALTDDGGLVMATVVLESD